MRVSDRSLMGFWQVSGDSIIDGPHGSSMQVLYEMTLAVVSHTAQEEARLVK